MAQRPSRKAKTKEAVLKHLNRDVELLTEDKADKRSSNKAAVAQAGVTQAGKESASRRPTRSVAKSTASKRGEAVQVPPTVGNSGTSSREAPD